MLRKCKLFSRIAMLLIGIFVLVIESPIPANAYRGEETAEAISISGKAEAEKDILAFNLDKPIRHGAEVLLASQPEQVSRINLPEYEVAAEAGLADRNTAPQNLEDIYGKAEDIVKKIEEAKAAKEAARKKAKEKAKKEKAAKEGKLEVLDESQTAGRTLKKRKAISLSAKELDCLQRIVQAEAGNEDIMGKLLVANVVLNRYRSKKFPNSIEEVVTQTSYGAYGLVYQFTPTRPGGGYWSAVPSKETIEAVERALNGEDYSEGALYFASRSGANPKHMSWFDRKLTWLFKHGNHEFYVG